MRAFLYLSVDFIFSISFDCFICAGVAMIESIEMALGLNVDNIYARALVYLLLAFVLVFLANLTIKLGPLALAKHKNRPVLTFMFSALRLPLSVSIIFIAISAILNFQLHISEDVQEIINRVLTTINIVLWGQFIYRTSQYALKYISTQNVPGSIIKPQTLPLLDNISVILIILVAGYLVFITWNIDMTAWLASAGIIGIAVGFAARDTVANLISGVFIMADSPYKIGDYIVIDSTDRGKVTHIGLRSTRILTRDDLEINIPNSVIANGKVVNESAGRFINSRVRIPVSVSYEEDIDQVIAVMMELAMAETQIIHDPEPRVRFKRFGGSGLDFELYVWINDPEIRGRVIHSLNCAIYKRFAQEGIEIPYSKHDLYIKSLPNHQQQVLATQDSAPT